VFVLLSREKDDDHSTLLRKKSWLLGVEEDKVKDDNTDVDFDVEFVDLFPKGCHVVNGLKAMIEQSILDRKETELAFRDAKLDFNEEE